MGLLQTDAIAPSFTSTLKPGPSRACSAFEKSTMMGLLHLLVCKVSKVLKNQKALASNQRKLAAGYNADHLEQPIELASISGSDIDVELEDEDVFYVLAPQFQDDPHSENEDAAVGGAAGGDDDKEEEESGENDGEDEEGRGKEDKEDDEDNEYQDD